MTMNAVDLLSALDRKIDVIMLVMPNPGPGLHERQRLDTLACRCGEYTRNVGRLQNDARNTEPMAPCFHIQLRQMRGNGSEVDAQVRKLACIVEFQIVPLVVVRGARQRRRPAIPAAHWHHEVHRCPVLM